MPHQKILILDFGSQYTQLIARRVRELGVYCEIYSWRTNAAAIKAFRPSGVKVHGGVIELHALANGQVKVDMGAPVIANQALQLQLSNGDKPSVCVVSMGNPHAVQLVQDVATAPVLSQGPLIENHAAFPKRVNAGFMQIVNRSEIRLRVFERGVGETLSCGTGACAAVVTGIQWGLLDPSVLVHTQGGDLTIAWQGGDTPVWMTGPANTGFQGEINLPDTL